MQTDLDLYMEVEKGGEEGDDSFRVVVVNKHPISYNDPDSRSG